MTFRVVIEPSAESDITEAFLWIAEDSPANAIRWEQELEESINSLATMPERCPVSAESAAFTYTIRQLLYGYYRVLFTIRGETVHVLHVRHGARRYLAPDE